MRDDIEKMKKFTAVMDEPTLELLEFYGKKLRCTRLEVMRALIKYGLNSKQTMKALGVHTPVDPKERGIIAKLPLGYYSE